MTVIRAHVQIPRQEQSTDLSKGREDLQLHDNVQSVLFDAPKKKARVEKLRNGSHKVTNLGGKIVSGLKSLSGKIAEAEIDLDRKIVEVAKTVGNKALELLGDFCRMICHAFVKAGLKAPGVLKSAGVVILNGLKKAASAVYTGLVVAGIALCVAANKTAEFVSKMPGLMVRAGKYMKGRLIVAYQNFVIASCKALEKMKPIVKAALSYIYGPIVVIHDKMKEHCYRSIRSYILIAVKNFKKTETCKKIREFCASIKYMFSIRKRRVCIQDNIRNPSRKAMLDVGESYNIRSFQVATPRYEGTELSCRHNKAGKLLTYNAKYWVTDASHEAESDEYENFERVIRNGEIYYRKNMVTHTQVEKRNRSAEAVKKGKKPATESKAKKHEFEDMKEVEAAYQAYKKSGVRRGKAAGLRKFLGVNRRVEIVADVSKVHRQAALVVS